MGKPQPSLQDCGNEWSRTSGEEGLPAVSFFSFQQPTPTRVELQPFFSVTLTPGLRGPDLLFSLLSTHTTRLSYARPAACEPGALWMPRGRYSSFLTGASGLVHLLWNHGLDGPQTNLKYLSTLLSSELEASNVPSTGLAVPAA